MKKIIWICLCVFLMLFTGCTVPMRQNTPSAIPIQAVRAVWIPYMEVEALLTSADPEAAIRGCVRDCASRGVNTLYFHVRANSDAYYASAVYTPTASASTLLSRGIDPLAVALDEAHRLGLSLHAWVNPYRIGTDAARAKTPDVFSFGERWYYVPTAESTHTLVVDGVRELVENYDIDGVQFDDYFYPVGAVEAATPSAFVQADYVAYTKAGGALSVGDWRRAAVNRLVGAVYAVCHSREGCVFGISPACDLTQVREAMYADAALWAKTAGYVDYLCPQIYFGFQHSSAPFLQALDTWSALERHGSVSLIAGLALYKTGLPEDTYAGSGKGEWAAGGDIIARQLRAVEAAGWQGAALYSHLSFEADGGRDPVVVEKEVANLQWTL